MKHERKQLACDVTGWTVVVTISTAAVVNLIAAVAGRRRRRLNRK